MAKTEDQQARLRRKLATHDMNPVADFLLSFVIMFASPFIFMTAYFHDKLMFKFLNQTYIYNVSWEDPRMDQREFNLTEKDHVITIASAGCNALDYIIEGAMVTAVDFNLCQIALTELKKVAILNIEFEQFFDIFSNSNMKLLQELYPTKLRPHLTAPSQKFWDDGVTSVKSFMYSGTSGNMAWLLCRVIFPLFGLDFLRQSIEKEIPIEELHKKLSAYGYSIRAIAWLMDNIMLRGGCCFAGVPERQMELGLHRPNNLAQVTEKIMFGTDLVNDNYFYAGYFLGYYKKHCCPRYLKKENYMKMRKHLQNNKLKLVHGTMLQAIDDSTVPITVASLLDHMDWMTDRMITEEITHLVHKMDPVRGKIFWRTFADDVHAAPLYWLNARKVDDHDDRVCMYWTTWIADLKDVPINYEMKVDTKQSKGLLNDIITGAKIVTFPFWKPLVASTLSVTGHAKDIESFYKYQKNDYDAFRENLLHARADLMEAFPLYKGGNMVWVDVGGGTARNLEFLTVEVVKKHFKKIVIVDISPSLLEMAQKRVDAMGLGDIVSVVEHDFTASSVFDVLPKAGTVDVITMSYSYSMIPNKSGAMANAAKMLKKGGKVAIADFFLKGKHDHCLPATSAKFRYYESMFHKWWFANDHVHLLTEKELEGESNGLEQIWDKRFRGSVPFIPFLQPYHGVYMLQKK